MTSGKVLKKHLGLDKYKNVYVSYVHRSSPDLFIITFDSVRPNMPISKQFLATYSNLEFYKRGDRLHISAPMDLEKSNLNLNTGIVMTYDIAHSQMTRRESVENTKIDIDTLPRYTERLEKKYTGRLNELTLKDLNDTGQGAISDRTFLWFQDRNKNGYTASKSFKLVDCSVSESDNSFTFFFLTEATEGDIKLDVLKDSDYDYNDPKGEVDTDSFNIDRNSSKVYEVQIKFTDLNGFLDYLKTSPDSSKVNKEDVVYLIHNQDVQYFSNSPSFHWQGYNDISSQLGLSIFPTTIKSKQWMPSTFGGEYFLDKHLYSFVRSYKFFSNQMAQMLNKKLKERGLI